MLALYAIVCNICVGTGSDSVPLCATDGKSVFVALIKLNHWLLLVSVPLPLEKSYEEVTSGVTTIILTPSD